VFVGQRDKEVVKPNQRGGETMRSFTIPGEPVAKARPRVTSRGIAYTPAKTKNYETLVKELYWAQYAGHEMLQGPLRLSVRAYFQIPKSMSRKRRIAMQEGKERPTKRPDVDNVIKAIADSLNGIAYGDDSQIVSATAEKFWGTPRVEVEIDELAYLADEREGMKEG
jgi:Holliday junction resolvase RusA-like endonuclease